MFCECPLCSRHFHLDCRDRSGEPTSPPYSRTCGGCRALGRACYRPEDEYRPEDLPPSMVHWMRDTGIYLPMTPMAVFNLPTYKTVGGLKTPTGRSAKCAHVMIGPMVERDLSTPKFVEQLSGM